MYTKVKNWVASLFNKGEQPLKVDPNAVMENVLQGLRSEIEALQFSIVHNHEVYQNTLAEYDQLCKALIFKYGEGSVILEPDIMEAVSDKPLQLNVEQDEDGILITLVEAEEESEEEEHG